MITSTRNILNVYLLLISSWLSIGHCVIEVFEEDSMPLSQISLALEDSNETSHDFDFEDTDMDFILHLQPPFKCFKEQAVSKVTSRNQIKISEPKKEFVPPPEYGNCILNFLI